MWCCRQTTPSRRAGLQVRPPYPGDRAGSAAAHEPRVNGHLSLHSAGDAQNATSQESGWLCRCELDPYGGVDLAPRELAKSVSRWKVR